MSRKSVYLDVDPSIIEKNMLITKEPNMEDELKNMLGAASNTAVVMPSKLVKPATGFCVKTHINGINKKLFINICQTDVIPAPDDITNDELVKILESDEATNYRVPMSIGEGRDEPDKSGQPATVYDIAINPKFLKKVDNNKLFQSFFLTVVFEALQDKYQIEINMNEYIILKNRKSVGNIQSHRIQIRDTVEEAPKHRRLLIEEIDSKVIDQNNTDKLPLDSNMEQNKTDKTNIEYRLYREPAAGKMAYLIGEFKISNTVYLEDLHLEVGEDRILLTSKQNIALDIFVPCKIYQDDIKAHLDRNTSILSLKMAASQ